MTLGGWSPGATAIINGSGQGSLRFVGNRIETYGWESPGIVIRAGDWAGEGVALECNQIKTFV